VLGFINEVYVADPGLSDIYQEKSISFADVFPDMLRYGTYFDNKTLKSFQVFCGKNDINFAKQNPMALVKSSPSRKCNKWKVYALKEENKGRKRKRKNFVMLSLLIIFL
jgi:hypothetical protein